jgi:CPA2 family monovalent cation:H+ antiporter-2
LPHHTPLIATIVAGLVGAFFLGAIAHRLKISPLIGYLLAGVIIGPFTPGYVADQSLANELAEIGVILLMFGVGLHFSLKDLLSVRMVAIPGALVQMGTATFLGMGLAAAMGWSLVSGFVFGLALSVASTVVLLRALQERKAIQTERGRIAVGWLIVEDLAMVLALVMLPVLARGLANTDADAGVVQAWIVPLALTVAKVGAFVAFMLIVGRRIIPWALHWVAHTGSRELFRLAVLAIALGVAFGAAVLFDVSFALGAFFAGMILAGSELSHRAAEETLPLRDAFAVLFFVSVGMLFNPFVLVSHPLPVLGVLAIIIVGKSLAALAIMRLFNRGAETSFTVAASLAQIGEFSFILAGLGVSLGLLPKLGSDLILAGAILSIMLNPLMFLLAKAGSARVAARQATPSKSEREGVAMTDHTVLIGFGRVGQVVAQGLAQKGLPFVVVETDAQGADAARKAGFEVVRGNCTDGDILLSTNIARARRILIAIPDAFEASTIIEKARQANPQIEIVARAHSEEEVDHLTRHGAQVAIMGEREIARSMLGVVGAESALPQVAAPSTVVAPQVTPPDKVMLSDGERALLDAFRVLGLRPDEAISTGPLFVHGEALGQTREQLGAALDGLAEKAFVTVYGDGRAGLTRTGFVRASTRPTPD